MAYVNEELIIEMSKSIDYEMSFEEIALELNISINQVRYAYNKAIKKFRKKI